MKPRIDMQHRADRARKNTAHHWALILAILSPVADMLALAALVDWRVYRRADRWLRDVEAFARRVLFALAVALKFKPVQRTQGGPPPERRPHDDRPRKADAPFRLQLFGARPAPYALIDAPVRRPETWTAYNAPRHYEAAPLHRRIAALRAVCADPLHHARRMARRMAHRFDRTPRVLRQLARYRPCMALRNALLAHFRERPEAFVGAVLRGGEEPPASPDDFGKVVPLFTAHHHARRRAMPGGTGRPEAPRQKRIFLYPWEIEDIQRRTPRSLAWNERHKAAWRAEARRRRDGAG